MRSGRVKLPMDIVLKRRHAQIQRLAYRLWEDAGRPEGDGVDFWLQGEKLYYIGRASMFRPLDKPALPTHWSADTSTQGTINHYHYGESGLDG